jgi:ATP diphosphatase
MKLQARAGTVGFDWNDPRAVLAKIREELDEVEAALATGGRAEQADEIGDVLFAVANLARHLGVDPDAALAGTNAKFVHRFGHVERSLKAQGRSPREATLEEMEALWQAAKALPRERPIPAPPAAPSSRAAQRTAGETPG